MRKLAVRIQLLEHAKQIPEYAHPGDSGCDLRAAIPEMVYLNAGESMSIPTGICLEIPAGYEAQVRGRSGIAAKWQVAVTQGLGTVDSGYRGEIKVLLTNHGQETFPIAPGDKIAQMVFNEILVAEFSQVLALSQSARGEGGFGSTGIN